MDKNPKSGVYRYRKAVPVELRPYLPAPHKGKREIIMTLGTKDITEAKRLHTLKSEEIERIIFDPARLSLTNVNPSSKHGVIRINMVMPCEPIEDDDFQLSIDHGHRFTLDQSSTPTVDVKSNSIRSILDLYLEQTSPSEKSVTHYAL